MMATRTVQAVKAFFTKHRGRLELDSAMDTQAAPVAFPFEGSRSLPARASAAAANAEAALLVCSLHLWASICLAVDLLVLIVVKTA